MSTNEPTKKTPPITVEEILRDRRRRLEAAVTPQGRGSGGWRERFASQPSDFPLQGCDVKKWLKHDSLPIERACFVLLGFEPPPLHVLRFVQDNYNPSREPTWEVPAEYNDVLASLRASIAHGNISTRRITEYPYETDQATWPDLIRWARSKNYPIVPELETIVSNMKLVAVAVSEAPPPPMETKEQRQDRRLKDCEVAGLNFKNYKGRLPDGVAKVADSEGVTRQSFSTDVKAALKRREDEKREGVTVHRA